MESVSRNLTSGIVLRGLSVIMLLCLVGQIWLIYGHFYRANFEDQFVEWFDGVNRHRIDPDYLEKRDEARDPFSMDLYDNIRSVDDAVDYIRTKIRPETEEEVLKAAHKLVSERFIHYMYPHHTWITNPFYVLFEMYDPNNSFDEMASANELLRHSAAGGCGDTSTVFIEVYRSLGGEAQYVQLDGHHLVEVQLDGRKWVVDADVEAIGPYSIEEIRENTELVDVLYAKHDDRRRTAMKKVFSTKAIYSGYDGVPYYGDYMYNLHKRVEFWKWFPAPAGFILALILYLTVRSRGRTTN